MDTILEEIKQKLAGGNYMYQRDWDGYYHQKNANEDIKYLLNLIEQLQKI